MSTKEQDIFNKDQEKYAKEFSENGLWDKISQNFKSIGKEAVVKALELYYTSIQNGTPMTVKALIFAVLGYLISPIDIVPDMLPVVGYTDDIGLMAYVISKIRDYITAEVQRQAMDKVNDWFGK